jgi:hypothetical protein
MNCLTIASATASVFASTILAAIADSTLVTILARVTSRRPDRPETWRR